MQQLLNKLVKQKTKINEDIGKIYYNINKNEEERNKINKEVKTNKRTIRSRRNKNKKNEDLLLRISEMKSSVTHYENDIIILGDRIIEFENLRNNINIKIKSF